RVEIRPGTQSGAVITLRGKGVPRLRSTVRGDLHVHVEVRTPTRLDAEQEKLLRELAELRNEDISVAGNRGGLFSKVRDAFGTRQPELCPRRCSWCPTSAARTCWC